MHTLSQGFLPNGPASQGHVWDGFSLRVFKTISSHPASSALMLSMFRNEPGVASRIARFSPAFALTLLPGFSAVPLADAVMFDGASSSVTISLWTRTRRAVI